MALSDALELPGTFDIARDRIAILFAGGMPSLDTFFGGPEDSKTLISMPTGWLQAIA